MLEVLDDLRVIAIVQLGADDVALIEQEGQPDLAGDGVGKGDVGVQVNVFRHGRVGNDGTLQVGGGAEGQFAVDQCRPVVGRDDLRGTPTAVHPPDGVDLERQLVPEEVAFGVGPVGVKGGVADGGQGAGVDGEGVDQACVVLGQLLGEGTRGGTVAALVGREVLEQHVLGAIRERVEGRRFRLPAVPDGQGNDGVVNDVTPLECGQGDQQKAEGTEERKAHQKLLVKVISNPLEAGTARQTPPMQKMPSRRFPYPMERRWAPSMRPTVPYR